LQPRASVLALVDRTLAKILDAVPLLAAPGTSRQRRVDRSTQPALRGPREVEETLVLDAAGLRPEGDDSAARLIVKAAELGWRRLITYNWRGGRFCGCGLGPDSGGVQIDVPYLEENERLFGIQVQTLLTVGDSLKRPEEVYRKVAAIRLGALNSST